MSKQTKLNNHVNFPNILGSKLKISNLMKKIQSTQSFDITIEEESFRDNNKFFSGNNVVVEQRRPVSSFDMLLLLQIIEYHQKYKNSELTEHKEYKITLDQEDKDLYKNEIIVKCFDDVNSEEYIKCNSIEDETEQKKYILDLIQKKADEQNRKKYDMFAVEKENYFIEIETAELLKQRGIRNKLENRIVIKNSLFNLLDNILSFYFFKDSVAEKIKEAKKGKKYAEWRDEVKDIFHKNRHKTKQFHRHIIENMSTDEEYNTIKIQINKGFLDYCSESQHFDYSHLMNLKLGSSKAFFVNSSFAYKEILSKEYVYDLMDLKYSLNSRNLSEAKESIKELVDVGFLDEKSGYDKLSGNFHIIKKQKVITKPVPFKKSSKKAS